jgi:small nuclear ribonucleoprotein (snRNP)-like protein
MLGPRPLVLRRRVLVNLKTGKALEGVLWTRRRGVLVLKDATLLEPKVPPVKVDGEVLVDRANVDFVQVAPARPKE